MQGEARRGRAWEGKRAVWRRWPLLLAALAVLALGGCVRRGGRVAYGNQHQILYWGNGAEPADLDPQTVIGEPESHLFNALFEGLVTQDPVDLHPIPGVAESWDVSPDGKTYTFHLRRSARWSNGDPLTSRDFLDSYRRILLPKLGAQYAEMMFTHVEVVNAREFYEGTVTDFSQVGFRAPDPHTFVVVLKNPAPYFLGMLNHQSWIPVHLPTILKYGQIDEKSTRWTRVGNFVGNGPFRLKAWRTNQELVVERNPRWWNARSVRLREIHYYPTDNLDTEERDFRAGLLHLTYEVPQTKIDVYRRHNPRALRVSPYFGCYFYRLNTTQPALKDKRVRRALAMAIDRDGIVANVTRGGQQPAHTYTPAGTAGYSLPPGGGIPTDYDGARRLLAEAGHPGGAGLPPVEILINTSQNHRAVAEVVQNTWQRELGVEARIVNQEWKVFLDSQRTLNYTVSRYSWIGDYLDPFTFLGLMVTGGGHNDTGFASPEYDRLIALSRQQADPAARRETLARAETLLLDEAPIAPIYFWTRTYLKQPGVRGWHDNFLDRHMPQFIYLEDSPAMEFKPERETGAGLAAGAE